MGITRRGIGGGLAYGLGQGLSNWADSRIKRRQLADQEAAQQELAQQKFGQSLLDKILGEKDPLQADRLIAFARANGMDTGALSPSTDQRLAPLLASIGTQSDPTKLPPDPTLAARSAGIDVSPTFSLMGGSQGTNGNLPSRSYGPTTAPAVRDIASLLQAKRDQIASRETETGANLLPVDSFDPASLTDVRRYLPKGQLPGQTFQTKPTPSEAGTMETEKDVAGKFSPAYTGASITAANQTEAGTRGEKVRTAGAITAANESARQTAGAGNVKELDGLADMVLSNPDLLDKFTPTQRGAVLAHIAASGGNIATKRDQAMNAMIDQAQGTIDNLKTLPGMSSAVGAQGPASFFGLLSAPLPGTAAADYVRYVDTLKSQITLPRLDVLKGLGRVTDREFKALADAVTALDRRMSEQQFKKELSTIETNLKAAKARNGGAPAGSNDATPPPGSTLNNLLGGR